MGLKIKAQRKTKNKMRNLLRILRIKLRMIFLFLSTKTLIEGFNTHIIK